ncbi:hypothetical protein ACIQ4I_01680 [Rummeliibacillus sp. NPDC094406]|uniref:hypothetical protein n=1 Tax=Rummeliibacillus sp. NPDC094406 TaxID=3364511 RepID=UPI0038286F44
MEKLLKKSALYGFVIGLGIAIIFVNYKEIRDLGNGGIEIAYLPLSEYIISVLRYGVIASFVGVLCGWIIYINQKK